MMFTVDTVFALQFLVCSSGTVVECRGIVVLRAVVEWYNGTVV